MHEYSVMTQLVKVADVEARKHRATKVLELTLEMGELALFQKPQLEFAFETLSAGTILEGAKLVFRDVMAVMSCPECQEERSMKDLDIKGTSAYYAHFIPLICPKCTKKMEVVKGKEFTIKEMKMDVPD
jgi:hydrogenase nickel incorporation protein HypA/HybF